ncbi:MAG: S-layer homology domain-containing protein, partial [Oscillospiraceae bacterium]|nr:S-layer homology domain-containing protein [Oscillospiraceae bacterium]
MKPIRRFLSIFLILALVATMAPVYAAETKSKPTDERTIHDVILIDDDPDGGYQGDYVVIYNPSTSPYSSGYSTGNMSGLIETAIGPNVRGNDRRSAEFETRPYKLDVDQFLPEAPKTETEAADGTKVSFNVGSKRTFSIYSAYSPTGGGSVEFKCLAVGQHCYIWTPTSTASNIYPLDGIDASFADLAAAEFDSKFPLMQSSFGDHSNGSQGDGKLHILYYNIDDGWQPGQPYVAGFFTGSDLYNNGLPMLNIDTYPGVIFPDSNGEMQTRIEDTYGTMVHEYQHLINYSNAGMSSWLNECFSAAAEEICYPGSSVIPRIQSWEHYYYSTNDDWLNPPAEFAYSPSSELHNGYSMYDWSNGLDDILALYAQVSLFAQYLYTRFGNTIYRQISDSYSGSEVSAITAATGVNCADLVRDFRIAVTASGSQSLDNGIYGFKPQNGFNPDDYHGLENPYSLLGPVVFTGTSCSIEAGGSITVKPIGGVYNPPSGANSGLKYYGISFSVPHTVTAVSNDESMGTVEVNGYRITAHPAEGCYVAGYEVTEGIATAVINGNQITVSAETDCTILVIFAPKPTLTVNFEVCGQSIGSQSALIYDEITLPASVDISVDGWTFSGWVAQQLPMETTDKPTVYAPGASYTVTANETLYAVYTRKEAGGEIVYELLSAAPEDWAGNYVVSYGITNSMYILKGVTVSSNGTEIENSANSSAFAATGITLEDNILHDVGDSYRFIMEPHGEYYSLRNASTNVYVGVTASSYLGGYNSYTAGKCDWTFGSGPNASSAHSAQNGQYPYFSFNTSNNYFWTGSSLNNNVRFWKATDGYTTYYCTSPTAGGHVHTPEYVAEVAPTCGEAGHNAYYRCTTCGKYFSDEACENEISPASTLIPATGNHSYGNWVSNNNGTHKHTCSVCGQTESVSCSYDTVVTEPTCTEGGHTTYTCTVCAYSYQGNSVPALGHDYSDWTVTTAPTCTAAGEETRTCSRCNITETRTVEALGHDYQAVVTEPSCTEGGYTTYTCSRCNDTYTADETEPLGHDYQAVVTEPSCTEGGFTTYTCSRCGDSYTGDETEPLGHDYQAVVTEPSCTEGGFTTYTCSRCGDSYTGDETEALGHDYQAVVTEPTCTEAGFTTCTCSRCGDSYTEGETEALGHDWGEPVVTVEPCHQFPGRQSFTCARCGETKTEEIPRLENPFVDVHDEDFFFNPVMWALDESVTGGVDPTHFMPERTVLRSDAVVFFWAANDRPEVEVENNPFKDVSDKHWAHKAVMWAVKNGITGGTKP